MAHPIVDRIREAGVVGAGGAGLPTHVKADAQVDTVLVNGASCEPLLSSDPHLMDAEIATVLRGLEALVECTGAAHGIVCLKGKHEAAMESVRREAAGTDRLSCYELDDFYPAGDEQILVKEVLGRVVPERGLPLNVGCVVANTETVFNIARALDGEPVTTRYLTVAGEIAKPMVVSVPVGTPVKDVLAFAGGPLIRDYVVVDGGPMMGRVVRDPETASVTKTTSGLLVLPPDHNVVLRKTMDPVQVRRITNSICCQCQRCTELCPRHMLGHSLHPHRLMLVFAHQEMDNPAAKEALLCSECGVCEKFACPMLLSPREVNAQIKQVLMKNGVRWQASGTPEPNPFMEERRIPTKRLIQRLDIVPYDTHPHYVGSFTPETVRIPLKQHLGAPAVCQVKESDRVKKGDLIGEIPEGAMAARVHASIDGTVVSVADGAVVIRA